MSEYSYQEIKEKEALIEEKRLEIKKVKQEKSRLHDLMDTVGNIYEYFAAPLCAISITLIALFTGPIVYFLPILMTIGAISVLSCKFMIRKWLDKLNKKLTTLKEERQNAYKQRESLYERIFNNLYLKNLDDRDFYHLIINASNSCEKLTDSMKPYKEKKSKLAKIRNVISRTFDYVLAPSATIVIPLICSLTSMGLVGQVIVMSVSSGIILGCVSVDDALAKKIGQLDEEITQIKSDRTVKYVERDLKLKESLEYLKIKSDQMKQKSNNQYHKLQSNIVKNINKKVKLNKK